MFSELRGLAPRPPGTSATGVDAATSGPPQVPEGTLHLCTTNLHLGARSARDPRRPPPSTYEREHPRTEKVSFPFPPPCAQSSPPDTSERLEVGTKNLRPGTRDGSQGVSTRSSRADEPEASQPRRSSPCDPGAPGLGTREGWGVRGS